MWLISTYQVILRLWRSTIQLFCWLQWLFFLSLHILLFCIRNKWKLRHYFWVRNWRFTSHSHNWATTVPPAELLSASLAAYFTSWYKETQHLIAYQSFMDLHRTKILVKIHVVRNETGDHQLQASGLEFKFQTAALKHLDHNKQLKKTGSHWSLQVSLLSHL